jgi:hypothetical protein
MARAQVRASPGSNGGRLDHPARRQDRLSAFPDAEVAVVWGVDLRLAYHRRQSALEMQAPNAFRGHRLVRGSGKSCPVTEGRAFSRREQE